MSKFFLLARWPSLASASALTLIRLLVFRRDPSADNATASKRNSMINDG
jgi:hypothetical protein